MTPPDPKPPKRIVDKDALALARLRCHVCVACGREPGSIHHVIPRGEGGDDVAANLVGLCGHGTAGCHGALHGNPYEVTVQVGHWVLDVKRERRDAAWVAERIGRHIMALRPDTVVYVVQKLGVEPGMAYLERRYMILA